MRPLAFFIAIVAALVAACGKRQVIPTPPAPPEPAMQRLATNRVLEAPVGTGCIVVHVERIELSDGRERFYYVRGVGADLPLRDRELVRQITFDVEGALMTAYQLAGLTLKPCYPPQPSRDTANPAMQYDYLLQVQLAYSGYNRSRVTARGRICDPEKIGRLRAGDRMWCLYDGIHSGISVMLTAKIGRKDTARKTFLADPSQIRTTGGMAQMRNSVFVTDGGGAAITDARVEDIFTRAAVDAFCKTAREGVCAPLPAADTAAVPEYSAPRTKRGKK